MEEIISDPSYNKAMEPAGLEPWPVPFDKLQAAIDADTQSLKSDVEQLKIEFE